MEESKIAPEDRVVYTDLDGIIWGPWRVVQVSEERITVLIGEVLRYPIHRDRLRKA